MANKTSDSAKPKPPTHSDAKPLSRGRPTKYKPEYCQLLIDHMSKGMSLISFGAVANVARDTLFEWIKIHKDFSDSYKIARSYQNKFFEETVIKAFNGEIENFNATAFVWATKNLIGWRDKLDIDSTHTENINVSIAMNINMMKLTDAQLLQMIEEKKSIALQNKNTLELPHGN